MNPPPSQRRGRRAVIIGGSMSGLFTAAFLRQIGWEADVYERSPVELVGRGAGITIDGEGRVIGEQPLRQILTSWDRLQSLLRETIPAERYHLGRTFERVEQDGSAVLVHFAEGPTERADLLVGGDGVRSGVRAQIAPQVQPIYAGYYIWRGAPNEADLAPATLASIFPHFTFFLPEREQVIGYPIAGLNNDLRSGHRRYNFIWYRVGSAELLREMCVDEAGRRHEFSVPPPLVRDDLIKCMREDAARIMPPAFLDALANVARPFFTPVYDFAAPRLAAGRIALVGDAAATARPHMGFGVSKAAGDALALAGALRDTDDIDAALARYDAERQPLGARIVVHGRNLGMFLGVNVKTEEDRAIGKLLSDHRGQMRHIAVPNFLGAGG